jgi:hypothetical protein
MRWNLEPGFFLYIFHLKVLKEFLFFAFYDCKTRDLSRIEFKMLPLTQILAINTVSKHSINVFPVHQGKEIEVLYIDIVAKYLKTLVLEVLAHGSSLIGRVEKLWSVKPREEKK